MVTELPIRHQKRPNGTAITGVNFLFDTDAMYVAIKEGKREYVIIKADDNDWQDFLKVLHESAKEINEFHETIGVEYFCRYLEHPELAVDMWYKSIIPSALKECITNVAIFGSKDNIVYIQPTIQERRMLPKEISKLQWQLLWMAEDMQEYKTNLAAYLYSYDIELKRQHLMSQFIARYYDKALYDHDIRIMDEWTIHDGVAAMQFKNDGAIGLSDYIMTYSYEDGKDKFYLHLMSGDKEVFKSREMPNNLVDAYSFVRGAVREQFDYEMEKRITNK